MEEQMNVENVEDSNGKDGGIVKTPSVKRPPTTNPTAPTNKNPKQQQKTQTTSKQTKQKSNLSKVYLLLLQILFAADAWISL